MVAGLTIIAAVPLFILSGMLEIENWIRVLLIGIGFVVLVGGIAIACVLDIKAGAYECPECNNRICSKYEVIYYGTSYNYKAKISMSTLWCT